MLNPKISSIKNTQSISCKIRRRLTLKKIRKESTKDSNNINHPSPKKYELERIKVLYKPLNPKYRFNSSLIDINEMVKKDNVSLISNDSLRNLIIKFREEREKELTEKKLLYKDKSYEDIKKEKNTNFLMLRAMLRKDPLTIQVLMNRHRNKEIKLKKSSSMKSILKSKNLFNNNNNKSTLTTEKNNNISNNNNSNSINNISKNKKNKFSKKDIWKKDFLIKIQNIKKAFLKKFEIKITSTYSLILVGHLFSYKIYNTKKKFGQDCTISSPNLFSAKLGEISLFGIFDGNGPYGKGIALGFKNYILNYFKTGIEMRVTLKKDNFYSIMYNSFINAQNYLKNNSNRLNINLKYSGATGLLLLYPHNNTNKVYCANLGRNKCIFYTMTGTIKLSYELFPNRASERFRISLFKQKQQNNIIDNNNNIKEENKKNNNNMMVINNNIEEITRNNDTENRYINEKEKENFIKEFYELDISRCIGNLAAEEYGVIPGPEIVESDIKLNKGKFIVMGTESLWKYLNEDEVGEIVNKHYSSLNSEAACKELQDLAKERWKNKTGGYDDISVIVIFLDSKNL